MKKILLRLPLFAACFLLPILLHAQNGVSTGVNNLHQVLQNVYNQMIPLCANLLGLSQAIAGLGTTFYIGYRVWKHIARAEPIDIFPLFRPMVIVLMIGFFPKVLSTINGVLQPSVDATAAMVTNSNTVIKNLLIAQANQLLGNDTASVLMIPNPSANNPNWDKYTQPGSADTGSGGGFWSAIGSGFKFLAGGFEASLRFVFRNLMALLLQILYYAASLCIDTLRTFHMIVLSILGPLAFAFSCYDGYQQSLVHWLGRYINIYLWLPVANLLGATLGLIEQNMIQLDITKMQSGDISFFSSTDMAYLIFMLIGIVGYFTVPGITNYIVHTHGPNPLMQKVSAVAGMALNAATGGASSVASSVSASGASGAGVSGGGAVAAGGQGSGASGYNRSKIAG